MRSYDIRPGLQGRPVPECSPLSQKPSGGQPRIPCQWSVMFALSTHTALARLMLRGVRKASLWGGAASADSEAHRPHWARPRLLSGRRRLSVQTQRWLESQWLCRSPDSMRPRPISPAAVRRPTSCHTRMPPVPAGRAVRGGAGWPRFRVLGPAPLPVNRRQA